MTHQSRVLVCAAGISAESMLKRLLSLKRDNPTAAAGGFRVEQKDDEATVYVYDVIGGWFGGISAEQFAREIAAIKASTIHVRINSPGGDVFDAQAMRTALKNHPAKKKTYIDGLAASAASYFALDGEVQISKGAFLMIHNAWGIVMGNKHDMRDTAGLLDKIDASIVQAYAAKAGNGEGKDWPALMDAETWFSADEALAIGLVDRIAGEEPEAAASAAAAWNLSAYDKAPEILRQPPKAATQPTYNRAALDRRLRLLERSAG